MIIGLKSQIISAFLRAHYWGRDWGHPDSWIFSRAVSENMSPWHQAFSPGTFLSNVGLSIEHSRAMSEITCMAFGTLCMLPNDRAPASNHCLVPSSFPKLGRRLGWVVVKSGLRGPGFHPRLCLFFCTIWLWVCYFPSLGLNFLFCKNLYIHMGLIQNVNNVTDIKMFYKM